MNFSEYKIDEEIESPKLTITNECDALADVIIDAYYAGHCVPHDVTIKYPSLFQLLAAFDAHGRFLLDSAVADLYRDGAPIRYEAFARACENNFLLARGDASWVQVVSPLALLGRAAQMARDGGLLRVQVTYLREYVGRFLTDNDDSYEFLRNYVTKEGVFINIDRENKLARRKTIFNFLELSLLAAITVLKYL